MEIRIVGHAKSGKSALAQIIRDALTQHGVNVILADQDVINRRIGNDVGKVVNGQTVTISEVRTREMAPSRD